MFFFSDFLLCVFTHMHTYCQWVSNRFRIFVLLQCCITWTESLNIVSLQLMHSGLNKWRKVITICHLELCTRLIILIWFNWNLKRNFCCSCCWFICLFYFAISAFVNSKKVIFVVFFIPQQLVCDVRHNEIHVWFKLRP